jgi:hypothetical protein
MNLIYLHGAPASGKLNHPADLPAFEVLEIIRALGLATVAQ